MNSRIRTRNWTVLVYPDSLPDDWRNIIDSWHIEWVESPLHDRDIDSDGNIKKPHIHILLMYGGVKSYTQVCECIEPLNCPIPQRCHNAKSLIRYMIHLDNPDKFQYSRDGIIAHGGVDLAEMLRPCSSERYSLISDMLDFIHDNHIVEFQDLLDVARTSYFDTWFPLLCDNSAYIVNQYIISCRCRSQ